MKYTKFKIENFKGINNITIDLMPRGNNIFTLVGLNESGKTSILEAINTFYMDFKSTNNTKYLHPMQLEDTKPLKLIPKNLISNFSNNIKITGTLLLDDASKSKIIDLIERNGNLKVNSFRNEIVVTKKYEFENSNYKKTSFHIDCNILYTPKKAKKTKNILSITNFKSDTIEGIIGNNIIFNMPIINYFPTFLFYHPEKIKIYSESNNQSEIDKIYTSILDKIAGSTQNKLSLKKHVIDRALNEQNSEVLEASLEDIASLISIDVFSAWKNILQEESVNDKEISLKCSKETNNDIFIQFQIKQGSQKYNFMDRSLGFRWFFSFLLFTHYNKENNGKSMLLLFDEPASNLHAKAQEELLNSFSKITENGNQIIYSTHSHYMINPRWLDQAYIIANSAINYNEAVNSTDKSVTDISATKYRNYVYKNPSKTTYFQPILDKLNITPSKLDILKPCVIVEGKSDYFLFEYGIKSLIKNNNNKFSFIPVNGATTIDSVVSLLRGWGVPFLILLDDDKAGRKKREQYIKEFLLDEKIVLTIKCIDSSLDGKELSSLLDNEDLILIKEYFNNAHNPSKSDIQLFFSEHLASNKIANFSAQFITYMKELNNVINYHFKNKLIN